jgi:ATP-dependent DNA helicase RecQ
MNLAMQTTPSSLPAGLNITGVPPVHARFPPEPPPESVALNPPTLTGIYRSNLHYRVIPVMSDAEKLEAAVNLVHSTEGAGVVYAATAKAVEALHHALQAGGESATLYHGQLPAKLRNANQAAFMNGSYRVMVASSAFSSGNEKRDIRFVIHHQLPASPELYCRESGIAGHDGEPAECTLLYYRKDKQVQQFFLARRYPAADEIGGVYSSLQTLAAGNIAVSAARLNEARATVPENRILVALKLLMDAGFVGQDERHDYRLTPLRAKQKELAALVEAYREQSARDHAALERVVSYAQTGFCRWKTLLQYVGAQVEWSHCGVCDNCLQPPEQALSPEHIRQSAPAKRQEERSPLPRIGSVVRVARFGEGRVVACAGDKITISFPDKKTRTFLRNYVEST